MIKRILTHQGVQAILLLFLLLVMVVFSFSDARWRQKIRNATFDQYNIFAPRAASDRVVIVDIDEASLQAVGQMPWPRNVMADLVRALKNNGAAVITFDIVFSEPDRLSPSNLRTVLPADYDVLTLPDNDVLFGEAVKQAGNVVTGFSFTHEQTGKVPGQKGIFRGKSIEQFVPRLNGASTNLKPISKHAAGNGSFFVSTDTDGIIRRVPMLVAHQRPGSRIVNVYPSLSLETLRVLAGERGGRVVLADSQYSALDPNRFGLEGIDLGKSGLFIPTNPRGEFLVYFSPSNPAWYISAGDVLQGRIDPEKIKDKIVLVGTSAVGLKDIRSTPLNAFIPGVEVHLNIIDQVLQGQFLRRSIEAEGIEAATVFLAGLFIIVATPFLGALLLAVLVTGVLGALLATGWYAFTAHGLLIDVAYPSLSIMILFTFSAILTYLRSEKDRRQIKQAFGQYISPAFMEELTKDPDKLKLGGEIRDLTVVFTDIRRFTAISEGLAPEELIQLMNDFLTPMSDLVMSNRGTIDKYMGDAMMAFWNAPLEDPHHAENACRAALGMQMALSDLNKRLAERTPKSSTKPPIVLETGIGINTGPCAVGNMGSRQRFDYSAIGDAVNLSSRLEGQTKTYGVPILIGEETYRLVPHFAALEVDLIRVKGKQEPVRIYGLLDDEELACTDEFKMWQKAHNDMIENYRAQHFKDAFHWAEKAAQNIDYQAMHTVYELYQKRCRDMIDTSPLDGWDGVYVATSK